MQPLSSLIPELLRDLKLQGSLAGWRAVVEWPQVVGERLARRTRATRWREGRLWVEVDGSVWMHELSVLKRDLVRRLNEHLGEERVVDLVFVLSRGGNQR
jgi:predicted nucleic acid-binding Zn ribbon protein